MRVWLLGMAILACGSAALAGPPPVSRAAVQNRAGKTFAAADANHDGWLTREEYRAAILAEARRFDPHVPAEGKGMDAALAQFDALDTAHAGRIARDRYVALALARFDGADLDRDGTVTPDEARKVQEARKKAAEQGR